MTAPIGFIGLGLMGSPVAGRLLTAHPIMVWNRSPAAVAPLAEAGGAVASSAVDVFAACRTVFMMVTDEHAVDDILAGAYLANTPQATITDVLKNARLVLGSARDRRTGLALMTASAQLYAEARGPGLGAEDMAAVITAYRARAAARLKE